MSSAVGAFCRGLKTRFVGLESAELMGLKLNIFGRLSFHNSLSRKRVWFSRLTRLGVVQALIAKLVKIQDVQNVLTATKDIKQSGHVIEIVVLTGFTAEVVEK